MPISRPLTPIMPPTSIANSPPLLQLDPTVEINNCSPLPKRSADSIAARAARVNSHLQSTARNPRQPNIKPCYAFFGRDRHCERGDSCNFSHDPSTFDSEAYKAQRGLIDCPNPGCTNYCRSTSSQCATCTQALYEKRAERKAKFDSRPEQQCKGSWRDSKGKQVHCPNMTQYKLCISCYQTEKQYIRKF